MTEQVDPRPYHENCVKDSCACDTGGDCECFCTAVAAYAQACNEAGVCVAWRTPEICRKLTSYSLVIKLRFYSLFWPMSVFLYSHVVMTLAFRDVEVICHLAKRCVLQGYIWQSPGISSL